MNVGDPLERQVVADGQVVDQRQRQQRVGRAPLLQREPLAMGPAQGRGRVGQVEQQRKDRRSPSARTRR